MKRYRLAAMAAMSCAAALSLAACTAGITTARSARSSSPAPRRAASSARAARPANAVRTVAVNAPIGSFPIPSGAAVIENISGHNQIEIGLGSVSPEEASSFYLSALPRVGYKITLKTLVTGSGTGTTGPVAEIEFTGHGYKGTISALAHMNATPGVSLGNGKNIVVIILTRK